MGQPRAMRSVPRAKVRASSARRYATCAGLGRKNPSRSSSARHRAKSSSMGASSLALRGTAAGREGRQRSIFHAFGERMWNSRNASVASAPVLLSM